MPVATVLTACGIETYTAVLTSSENIRCVATVLTACGIETHLPSLYGVDNCVATVLTACGIETKAKAFRAYVMALKQLQQYLPLAVLKQKSSLTLYYGLLPLQQYLPLAVLKLILRH